MLSGNKPYVLHLCGDCYTADLPPNEKKKADVHSILKEDISLERFCIHFFLTANIVKVPI